MHKKDRRARARYRSVKGHEGRPLVDDSHIARRLRDAIAACSDANACSEFGTMRARLFDLTAMLSLPVTDSPSLPKKRVRRVLTCGLIAILAACTTGTTYNPTVFPFEIETERLAENPIRTVVVAHVNLGAPSRNYLEETAPRIDAWLSSYLEANGIEVLDRREFQRHWNTAVRAFGEPLDPTTGKVNMKAFAQIMESVRDRFAEDSDLDAFLFTNILELEIPFNGGLKHIGRWDGVSRRPSLQGAGTGVSADFDWNTPATVATLQVTLFDMELQRVFISRGGLDSTDAIDARSSSGRWVRRRQILESRLHVDEGIALALHPLVEMAKYPGNP